MSPHQLDRPDSESDNEAEIETDPSQTLGQQTEEEGELSDHNKDSIVANQDLMFSEEQSYRETVRGIRSYMAGVTYQILSLHIP